MQGKEGELCGEKLGSETTEETDTFYLDKSEKSRQARRGSETGGEKRGKGRQGEERSGNRRELKAAWEGHSLLRDRRETKREEEVRRDRQSDEW